MIYGPRDTEDAKFWSEEQQRRFSVSLEEYKALRSEILARLDHQYKLTHFSILLFSAFLSMATLFLERANISEKQPEWFVTALLIAPIPFCFLLWSYQEQNFFISQIGTYINRELSHKLIDYSGRKILEWEEFLSAQRGFHHDLVTASRFIFLNIFAVTPLILLVYFEIRDSVILNASQIGFLILDAILLLSSVVLRGMVVRRFKRIGQRGKPTK